MLCSSGSIGEGGGRGGGGVFFFVPFSVGCLETWKRSECVNQVRCTTGTTASPYTPMINMDNAQYMIAKNINKYLECSRKLRATT